MNWRLLLASLFILGSALPAAATERFISPSGSGATCSEGSPCSWTTAFNASVAGDIITALPGTYTSTFAISGKSGTSTNRITLRAQNPAVSCADPENDPDGCTVNANNRSIVSSGARITLSGNNADWWSIEGFEIRGTATTHKELFDCSGTSRGNGPNDNRARFLHYQSPGGDPGSSSSIHFDFRFCENFTLEHSYITQLTDPRGGYALRLWAGTTGFIYRNIYVGGGFSYGMNMRNNAGPDITIERLICEGINICLNLAQQYDRSGTGGTGGGPTCSSAPMTDGVSRNIVDGTISNVTVRRAFARPSTEEVLRYGMVVWNVRNLDAQNLFFANPRDPAAASAGVFSGPDTVATGDCGVDPGNNVIRGLVVVNPSSTCTRMFGTGWPSSTRIENMICHDSDSAAALFGASSGIGCAVPPLETCQHPITTLRNDSYSSCPSVLSGNVSGRLTQDHNNVSSCGSLSGATTLAPSFAGSTTVATPTVASKVGHGATLWNWDDAGGYQEIINNFQTGQAGFVDAGTGTEAPCTGASCDIGGNEFFLALPPGVWASCAVYQNGEEVFDDFTDPWIDGRTGLVVDVDCVQQKIVIGRCTDPLDESTCDTDIYIHKSAQLRKKRVNQTISLSSGVTGGPEDTGGNCWRTRATYDFTESLEELTGIWVRYEIDPDGGTHTCNTASPPQWAWQAAD